MKEDEVRVKIISALNNPKYRARTIHGIIKETSLDRSTIVKALKSDKQLVATIKLSPLRATNGSTLITTKERFNKESSVKEKFIDFFSSNRAGLDDAE